MVEPTGRRAGGVIAALSLLVAASAQAHPSLFFTAAEEPALQSKVQAGVPLYAYGSMCDGLWSFGWPSVWGGKCLEEVAFRYRMQPAPVWAGYAQDGLDSALATSPDTLYDPGQMEWFGALPIPIAVAYDFVYDALDAPRREQIVATLEQYGELLFGYLEQGQRSPLEPGDMTAYAGLGLLTLAIRDDSSHPDREAWLAAAATQLGGTAFHDGYNPGGAYDGGYGGSVWGSPEALRFAEAYRRASGVDLVAGSNLEQAPAWLTYGWLPHLRHAGWGDGASYLGGQAFAGEHLITVARSGDPLGKWGWGQIHGPYGVNGLYRPVPLSDLLAVALWYPVELIEIGDPTQAGYGFDAWFHDTANPADGWTGSEPGLGGAVVLRNGWSQDSVALAFKVSDEWQPLSHNDSSSFILSAYGVEMAMDPPSAEYPDRDDHSVVLVSTHNDGAAKRTSYRGALREVFSSDLLGYASADGRYPSGLHDPGDPEDPGDDVWSPVERADRALALVRGPRPYVIVGDDVSGDLAGIDTYNWLMQLGQDAWIGATHTGEPADPIRIEYYGGQQLLATVVSPATGYLAEVQWHPYAQAHRQLVVTTAATTAHYLMILQPRRWDGDPEQPVITRLTVSGGSGAELQWYDYTDEVLVGHDGAISASTGSSSDGRLVLLRRDYSGAIAAYAATEATRLFAGAIGLLDTGGVRTDAALSSARLELQTEEAPAPRQIAAYGPGIVDVRLNGIAVAFDRVGDYVLVPAECAAEERCNGSDDDCDGIVDEPDAADAATFYGDDDGDGFGDAESALVACGPPDGYVGNAEDCDDRDRHVNPGTPEDCFDAEDDDCDGLVDELDPDCAEPTAPSQGDTTCTCRLARREPRPGLSVGLLALATLLARGRRGQRGRR